MGPQVLVVGAGPVGLTMAAELARFGVAVRIVDKAARATETSKALVLWSRTLELIERMGCVQTFLEAGNRVDSARWRSTAPAGCSSPATRPTSTARPGGRA